MRTSTSGLKGELLGKNTMNQEEAIELASKYQMSKGPARKVVRVVMFDEEACKESSLVWPTWAVSFEATDPRLRDEKIIIVQGDGTTSTMIGM
jgi:hypothetical protein